MKKEGADPSWWLAVGGGGGGAIGWRLLLLWCTTTNSTTTIITSRRGRAKLSSWWWLAVGWLLRRIGVTGTARRLWIPRRAGWRVLLLLLLLPLVV